MSHQIYFDTERELHFCLPPDSNALKEFKEESILSTCAFLDPKNITFFDQLDFAAKLVDQNDIKRFYLLKTQLMSNLEKERNQKDL